MFCRKCGIKSIIYFRRISIIRTVIDRKKIGAAMIVRKIRLVNVGERAKITPDTIDKMSPRIAVIFSMGFILT